jgi:hypothetical protein
MIAPSHDLPARAIASSRRAGAGSVAGERAERVSILSSRWLIAFVSFEFLCQVALLFPELSVFRVFFRSAPFVASVMLLALPGRGREYHPARYPAMAIIGILAVSMLHPSTNSLGAGLATVALNLAILSPIFWVPRLRLDTAAIHRLVLLFWAFQSASAAVGALQVYFPGRFEPATSTMLADSTLSALKITLADGTRVYRPMGLTDGPGGAGIGGMYCVLFAVALWLERPRLLFRLVLLCSMGAGLFALYLCQVRSLLVMLIPAFLVSVGSQLSQRRFGRIAAIVAPLLITALVAFVLAVAVGGDTVTNRLSTLIEDDPRSVYYTNRGLFLEHTFRDLLPQYPLGAGLGRWGMMSSYFGDPYNAASPPIWAEIQWTAWLIDGGIPLMLAASTGMFLALREASRAAVSGIPALRELSGLSGIFLGYSLGVIALTFNACPFAGTVGIDFWLFNAAFFAAVSRARRSAEEGASPAGQVPQRAAVRS